MSKLAPILALSLVCNFGLMLYIVHNDGEAGVYSTLASRVVSRLNECNATLRECTDEVARVAHFVYRKDEKSLCDRCPARALEFSSSE